MFKNAYIDSKTWGNILLQETKYLIEDSDRALKMA